MSKYILSHTQTRGGSRTSPRRGRQFLGGAYPIFSKKNPMKLKKFWFMGGGAPLKSATTN